MSTTPLRRWLTRLVAVALVLAATLSFSAVSNAASAGSAPAYQASGASMASSDETEAIIAAEFMLQFNNERAARGVAAVDLNIDLSLASIGWSDQMARSNSLTHSGQGRAEVVGYGYNSGQVTDAFMRSKGHRDIITDPNMTIAGFGVSCDAGGRLWITVQFLQAVPGQAVPSSPASPIATSSSQGSGCDTPIPTGQVRRLYAAYFLRSSDQGGLAFWMAKVSEGWTLSTISDNFAGSTEFRNRYGSLSNRDFVKLVYQNVMGRSGEASGVNYWTSRLNVGMSRGEMMIGFSDSAEFVSRSGIR